MRSLGLGLALCRSIVAAHGSTITLRDNVPAGCIFSFCLPLGEVKVNE
jgi:two-component system sensor histidine kinase KdpD